MTVPIFVRSSLEGARYRIAQRAAKAGHARDADFRSLGVAINRSEKRGPSEIDVAQERIAGGRDPLEVVDRQRIARRLTIAHFPGARVDFARQPAAIAGVGDEQDLRALGLELLDHMVEFGADDALLSTGPGLRIEAGKHEDVVEAVGLRPLDVFGLLHAVTRNRQHHQIARLAALHELVEGAHHGRTVGRRIVEGRNVRHSLAS